MKRTTATDAFEQGKTAYTMGMKLSRDPYDAGAPGFTEEGLRSDAWRRGMITAWEADGRPEGRIGQHPHDGANDMKSPQNSTEQPAEQALAPLYSYVVNLNERGCFSASVYDSNEKSVYEVRGGDELGEDESSLVDDGFMRHMEDLDGLTSYLQSLDAIPAGARILPEKEYESALDEYIEEQREANRRVIYVLVAPNVSLLDLQQDDQEVPGAYQVLIYSDLPPQDWADTALDCFHCSIAIDNLEDFEITVVDAETQQILSQRDDYEASSGVDNGEFDDKLDTDWERYMPAQQDASPAPSM